MSGYLLHTKVLKLVFSFSLDTFIITMSTSWLFSFFFFLKKSKTRKTLSRKEVSHRHKQQLGPPPGGVLVQWRASGDPKSCLYLSLVALLPAKHNLMGTHFPTCKPNWGELNAPEGPMWSNTDTSFMKSIWIACLRPGDIYPEGIRTQLPMTQ